MRITSIPLVAIGGDTFIIKPSMFMVDGVQVLDVKLHTGGVFNSCSRVDDTTLNIDNPASGTQNFDFEIEYKTELPGVWTYTSSWWQTGKAYYSLGTTAIGTAKVRGAIGGSSNKIGNLSISALINPYSWYKSNKIAGHGMSEWKLYTHAMPGGVGFLYEVYVQSDYGGSVYEKTNADIPWLYSYKVLAILGTRYIEISGYPYSYTKLESLGTFGSAAALGGLKGVLPVGLTQWSGVFTNNDAAGAIKSDYFAKSWHCATSGGTYIQGQSLNVPIVHSAKSYSLNPILITGDNDVSAYCQVKILGHLSIPSIRFQARDNQGYVCIGYLNSPQSDAIYQIEASSAWVFPTTFDYRVDVKYSDSATYNVLEASRGSQSGFATT